MATLYNADDKGISVTAEIDGTISSRAVFSCVEPIYKLLINPNGSRICVVDGELSVVVWDTNASAEIFHSARGSVMILFAFHPSTDQLLIGRVGGTAVLFAWAAGVDMWKRDCKQADWNTEASRILTIEDNYICNIWCSCSFEQLQSVKLPHRLKTLHFSPNSSLVAGGGFATTVLLFDSVTGLAENVDVGVSIVFRVAFTPTGKLGFIGVLHDVYALYLWDPEQHELLGSVALPPCHNSMMVTSLSFSSCGSRFAYSMLTSTASLCGTYICDIVTAETIAFLPDSLYCEYVSASPVILM